MKLPGGKNAVVGIAKLREYCLSSTHPRGRHKARVFATALGFTAADAEVLREALLHAAIEAEAVAGEGDDYGQRYVLDSELTGPKGKATTPEQLDYPARRRYSPNDQLLRSVRKNGKY